MATIGPKAHKRQLRKSVTEVSIPQVCAVMLRGAPLLLRVSSSLLYGLSLLYKQKVGFMATDISVVFDRISTLAVIGVNYESDANLKEPKIGKRAYLCDDPLFSLDEDFISDWPSVDESNPREVLQRILDIKLVDRQLNGVEDDDEDMNPRQDFEAVGYVAVPEETFGFDFEFDDHGNIVDGSGQQLLSLLADLNLDEDFSASGGVVEDLLQPMHSNSISNDTHFATTLNLTEASVTQLPKKDSLKRRRVVVDLVTTIGPSEGTWTRASLERTGRLNLVKLIGSESETRPHFINLCYRMALGSYVTREIPSEALPLVLRHPGATNLESFLKEIDDIERGRDVVSRRPSLSFIEDIAPLLGPDVEQGHRDLDLELGQLSPMEEETEYSDSDEYTSAILQKLDGFEEFLREKAEFLLQTHGMEELTFQRLIPSILDNSEDYVSRRIAARSFAYVLELATRSVIGLSKIGDEGIQIQFY